jgi:hypothetical protein
LGTIASGTSSHAEGNETKAYGNNCHAEGYETTAGIKVYTVIEKYKERTDRKNENGDYIYNVYITINDGIKNADDSYSAPTERYNTTDELVQIQEKPEYMYRLYPNEI